MKPSAPVILEVALNGVTTPEQNAAVPREPEAIAEEALRCLDAGAAVVHTHTHDPMRPAEAAAALYREAYRPILAERPDAILYPTMGMGDTIEERYGHHEPLAAEGLIRQGLLDPGSVNLGSVPTDASAPVFDYVYANPLSHVHHEVEACARLRLGPSIAIFEPGFLRVILAYHRAGRLPAGALVKFYFSQGGYFGSGEPSFSAPPIPEALDLYLAMIEGTGLPWAVAVLGGPLLATPIAERAVERGGHLRVGLEDYAGPRTPSNLELVREAVALCAEVGRPVARPKEAAELLRLPG